MVAGEGLGEGVVVAGEAVKQGRGAAPGAMKIAGEAGEGAAIVRLQFHDVDVAEAVVLELGLGGGILGVPEGDEVDGVVLLEPGEDGGRA